MILSDLFKSRFKTEKKTLKKELVAIQLNNLMHNKQNCFQETTPLKKSLMKLMDGTNITNTDKSLKINSLGRRNTLDEKHKSRICEKDLSFSLLRDASTIDKNIYEIQHVSRQPICCNPVESN